MPWLREQFRLLRPKIVVCLGRIAAQRMIRPGFSVTKEHGVFVEKGGVAFMGTFHPAALLRQPQNKPAAFADFVALRDKIHEVCQHTYPSAPIRPLCGKIRCFFACAAAGAPGMRPAFRPSLPLRQAFLWHSAPLLHTLCQKRGVLLWK